MGAKDCAVLHPKVLAGRLLYNLLPSKPPMKETKKCSAATIDKFIHSLKTSAADYDQVVQFVSKPGNRNSILIFMRQFKRWLPVA